MIASLSPVDLPEWVGYVLIFLISVPYPVYVWIKVFRSYGSWLADVNRLMEEGWMPSDADITKLDSYRSYTMQLLMITAIVIFAIAYNIFIWLR